MKAAAAERLFDSGPLRLLPVAIREPRRAWLAILAGGALTLCGSLLLSWIASLVAPDLAKPDFPARGPLAFAMLVGFAPLVETLIMAAVLSLLARIMAPTSAVLVSALGWGLVIWWPFLVFSSLFMVWRQRGTMAGIAVAAATHALQNLAPALAIATR